MMKWEAEQYDKADERAREAEAQASVELDQVGAYTAREPRRTGTISQAYAAMQMQKRAEKQAEVAKMIDLVSGLHSVDSIVEKLYDSGYRKN